MASLTTESMLKQPSSGNIASRISASANCRSASSRLIGEISTCLGFLISSERKFQIPVEPAGFGFEINDALILLMLHLYEHPYIKPKLPPRFSPLGRGSIEELESQQPSWGYRVDPNTSPPSKAHWSHANHALPKGSALSSPALKHALLKPGSKEGDPIDNPSSGKGSPRHLPHSASF